VIDRFLFLIPSLERFLPWPFWLNAPYVDKNSPIRIKNALADRILIRPNDPKEFDIGLATGFPGENNVGKS
jgi:hypothetical protein